MDDYRAGHIERRNRLVNKEEYVLQLLVGSSERSKVTVSAEGIGLALQESPEFPTTISIREGLTPIALRVVANRQTNSGRLLTTLQDDGLLLAVSFVVGILSLLVFGFLVWTSASALENLLGAWLHLPWRKS
jgi:hypothetical protein